MPSGVVCFDAALGDFPSWLIIYELFEYIEAQIHNFNWKKTSYLSLFSPPPLWYSNGVLQK